jgi:hypothetical protein
MMIVLQKVENRYVGYRAFEDEHSGLHVMSVATSQVCQRRMVPENVLIAMPNATSKKRSRRPRLPPLLFAVAGSSISQALAPQV